MQARTQIPTSGQALLGAVDALQERVNDLERTLEQRERLATLGTIAGLIAHEFNNILTPVISYAQMAQARPDDAVFAQRALTRTLEGAERAARIAEALLGFVRESSAEVPRGTSPFCADDPAAGGGDPCSPRSQVRAAIDRALTCLARNPASDGIELSIDATAGLAAAIRPIALEHALLNVLLNARSAIVPSEAGASTRQGGTIKIHAEHRPTLPAPGSPDPEWGGRGRGGPGVESRTLNPLASAHGWVVVSISDSGRGMSKEQLARIFRPLSNRSGDGEAAGAGSGGGHGGTGLGTTVCRKLIEDAGGAVRIESSPGAGTTVRLIVPAAGPSTSV